MRINTWERKPEQPRIRNIPQWTPNLLQRFRKFWSQICSRDWGSCQESSHERGQHPMGVTGDQGERRTFVEGLVGSRLDPRYAWLHVGVTLGSDKSKRASATHCPIARSASPMHSRRLVILGRLTKSKETQALSASRCPYLRCRTNSTQIRDCAYK